METIRITGEISADSARDLRRRLDAARGDDVLLEINSFGGSAIAGLKMYGELKDYKGATTAHIAHAGSAATLVVCGCDRAVGTPQATVFIHAPTAAAVKDVGLTIGELQEAVGSLRRTGAIIAAVYARKNSMGWPVHRAIGVYQTMMAREGGTTWGPGRGCPLIDSYEGNGHRRIDNLASREPIPADAPLAEIALGAFKAGVEVGVEQAVAAIAKERDPRAGWRHCDGTRFGQRRANQLPGVD